MSRVLYFDCFSGISGDMTLGALLDAGLPLDDLRRALGSLALGDVELRAEKVLRTGVSATKFSVHRRLPERRHPEPRTRVGDPKAHAHRHLPKIFKMIDGSALSPAGRDRAKAMFQRLGEAEAAIHQMPVEKVHLHEVGALDSIIDIVGAVFALEWAGADRIVCSPLNVGGGMVHSAHGVFPVPAPATVQAARRRADLQRRRAEGAGDADRRADRDDLRLVVRPDPGDDGRARRLRRRRPRRSGDAERAARADRRGDGAGRTRDGAQARRSRHRHRVRDRRHEPADLRRR